MELSISVDGTPCSSEGIEWSLEAEDFASFVLLRFGRGLLGSTSDGLCVKAAGRLGWPLELSSVAFLSPI